MLASCGGGNLASSASSNAASSNTDSSSAASSITTVSSTSTVSSSVPEVAMAGTDTKADPYLPLTAKHWVSLASLVCGETMVYVQLSNNIDLSGVDYVPIGTAAAPANIHLNGKGFAIQNMTIPDTTTGITAFGLFGVLNGVVDNLSLDGTISYIAPKGQTYAGLIAGCGLSAAISGVHVSGQIQVLHSDAITDAVPIVGGIIGYQYASDYYFCTIEESSSTVSIEASAEKGSYVGGIVGYLSIDSVTWGATTVNNCWVDVDYLKGGSVAGGVIGFGYYYSSIVNCYVKATTISASADEEGIAGGLAGLMFSETGVNNSIAQVGTINAGATSSIAGDLVGSLAEDSFDNGYGRTAGAEVYQCYAKGAALTGASKKPIDTAYKIETDALTTALLTAMQFSTNVWRLTDHQLPEFLSYTAMTLRNEITYTVKLNNGTDETEAFKSEAGQYQPSYAPAAQYANHVYVDSYYDEACTASFRWYVPNNSDTTLYNSWFDGTKIAGFYGGANTYNGVLAFAPEGTMVWLQNDGYSAEGTWWSDGTHLIFDTAFYEKEVADLNLTAGTIGFLDPNDGETEYAFTKKGSFFGYWRNANGLSLFLDGNGAGYYGDGDTITAITYTKTEGGFVTLGAFGSWAATPITQTGDNISFTLDDGDAPIAVTMTAYNGEPDYSKKAFVGTYHGSSKDSSGKSIDMKLDTKGNIDFSKDDFQHVYGYGGYRQTIVNNVLSIKSSGVPGVGGDYKWTPSKKVLLKTDGSVIYAQTGTYAATYATSDNTIRIFVYSDANYLVINNNLDTTTAITGTIADGQTISIGANDYTITGMVLAKKNVIDYTPLVNTYEMFINGSTTASSNVLVLNADKTGTYNGDAIAYTYDGTKVAFTYNAALTFDLAFDATAKTLTGTMDDGDTTTNIVFKVKTVTPVETKNMLGTFSGTVTTAGANHVTASIVITDDGKITYTVSGGSAVEGTWTGDKATSISPNWDDFDGDYDSESGTITYDATADAITLDLSGAFSVTGTISRAA